MPCSMKYLASFECVKEQKQSKFCLPLTKNLARGDGWLPLKQLTELWVFDVFTGPYFYFIHSTCFEPRAAGSTPILPLVWGYILFYLISDCWRVLFTPKLFKLCTLHNILFHNKLTYFQFHLTSLTHVGLPHILGIKYHRASGSDVTRLWNFFALFIFAIFCRWTCN